MCGLWVIAGLFVVALKIVGVDIDLTLFQWLGVAVIVSFLDLLMGGD
jgi:hypothetical protein